MLDLIADNTTLRTVLLILLFAGVVLGAYFSVQALAGRQIARRRLL